jgi:AraC-like DNA-binding protein/lambda repressor-like predicted transcriptional regulator
MTSISARMPLRVVAFCERRGHDGHELCRRAGLSREALSDPNARVPYQMVERLGELALELTGDEYFGLHLAADVGDTGQFDMGLLLLMASPNVREALERMVRYQRFWGDGERATLHAARPGSGLSVRYVLLTKSRQYSRHAHECALAELAMGVRVLSGRPITARRVRFRHHAPRDIDQHHALFRCPIDFAAAHTEIEFDAAALETPMQHANAAFAAIFEQQLTSAIQQLPEVARTSSLVVATVRAALSPGSCTMSTTARTLGMSRRTLQRRLREEGTSFRELADSLREHMAKAYMERGVPVSEIARILGYSDSTALHHALRRWRRVALD